jgi:hypothetical protein
MDTIATTSFFPLQSQPTTKTTSNINHLYQVC